MKRSIELDDEDPRQPTHKITLAGECNSSGQLIKQPGKHVEGATNPAGIIRNLASIVQQLGKRIEQRKQKTKRFSSLSRDDRLFIEVANDHPELGNSPTEVARLVMPKLTPPKNFKCTADRNEVVGRIWHCFDRHPEFLKNPTSK